MIKFTEFPPVPGSVDPTADFEPFLQEHGTKVAGEAIGGVILASVDGNTGLTQQICQEFLYDVRIYNLAMQKNFMRGVTTVVNRAIEGGNQ